MHCGWAGVPAAAMAPRAVLLVLAAGCAVLGAAEFSPSLDSDFTFTLPAGRRECFYQPMRKEASLELEYQVGGGGAARGAGVAVLLGQRRCRGEAAALPSLWGCNRFLCCTRSPSCRPLKQRGKK